MPEVFSLTDDPGAHARVQAWRAANEDAFILNLLTRTTAMLHRADCRHFGGTWWEDDGTGGLAKKTKVCDLSPRVLREWAQGHAVANITLCSDCEPREGEEQLAVEAEAVAGSPDFDPDSVEDAREKVLRAIVMRRGQPEFRRQLLNAYGSRCAITGCSVPAVLDAAHIIRYQGPTTNHVKNGLLLRTDIHTLFDLGLVAVDAETMTVLLADELSNSPYGDLAGKKVRVPEMDDFAPNRTALDRHRKLAGL
jgi:hypothetical protein